MSPLLSFLHRKGLVTPVAYDQVPVFDAAALFTRAEGIIPAPESAHAIRAAIDEALDAKAKGEERVIVFGLSGHGFLDLGAYDAYVAGQLTNFAYPYEKICESLEKLPQVSLP
jgi:tryptophan synthase beta chain